MPGKPATYAGNYRYLHDALHHGLTDGREEYSQREICKGTDAAIQATRHLLPPLELLGPGERFLVPGSSAYRNQAKTFYSRKPKSAPVPAASPGVASPVGAGASAGGDVPPEAGSGTTLCSVSI